MSSPGRVSAARACAFSVLRRVFEHGAYADRALQAEASGLDARDRALATILSYGTVQRRATLDHVAGRFSTREPQALDPIVLAAVRLGLFQILFLGGVADHAAVNESVELVKLSRRGGAPLVNAVLRRAIREGPGILAELDDARPQQAAILHSVPTWLAERWFQELGEESARALLSCVNQPAESAVRVNTLVAQPDAVADELPVPWHEAPELPEGLVLESGFDVRGSRLFADGAVWPQSRASMLVARVLAPQPGQRVLDLCAAPGSKTTHLAALMEDRGRIVAVERHAGRARELALSCRRLRASCVEVQTGDATQLRTDTGYHRVLVDPPCTGLGTLQSRPDLRWRVQAGAAAELAALQSKILDVAAAAVGSGGQLVYSVCTISRAESEEVVDAFLHRHRDFAADDLQAQFPHWAHPSVACHLQLLPHRDGTDGFFIARLTRR